MDKERIELIFFLTWLVPGVASLYLFFINKNAAFKNCIPMIHYPCGYVVLVFFDLTQGASAGLPGDD